ncbi:hypothetical protein Taro_024137 [Colocasia esculenta]|uniref:YGL010w-like protein n=1 Tax=Colocasia esculenta TaxID=4460 RepID=A0A843VDI9_COLES|nr:hypothetical protein [Colocasia esculenta]
MGSLFDVATHFAFYGAYHSAPINVLIHIIFVWPIFYTALLLFYFTPPFFHVSLPLLGPPLVFNFGFAFAAVYALFYVALDRRAGSLAALLCALCWVVSCFHGSHLGVSLGWKVAVSVHVLCWIAQFIGHGVFEGRAPALLDNLVQALVMAPFFVLLEVLHKFFNYEPYPGFHESVEAKIHAEQKQWQASKQKKSS